MIRTAQATPLLVVLVSLVGCAADTTTPEEEANEIISNLIQAGYPADDIQVVDGVVYAGQDAAVTLDASREMLDVDVSATGKEQYRTRNVVSRNLDLICIYDGNLHGRSSKFSAGLDAAIANYNALHLTFRMIRISKTNTDNTNCDSVITIIFQAGAGGESGFPSAGHPYPTVKMGTATANYSVDVVEHVFAHEFGHTIGLRHSDYYNRSISCNTGGNEGAGTIGAILIPGTPAHATVGGSLMNSCFRSTETGEFTASDRVALQTLY